MERLKSGVPSQLQESVVGVWDFSRDISATTVTDVSPNRLHGETVNMPARGMKGYNWGGESMDWKQAPEQYGAIHFHDDDVYDAGWEVDFFADRSSESQERPVPPPGCVREARRIIFPLS